MIAVSSIYSLAGFSFIIITNVIIITNIMIIKLTELAKTQRHFRFKTSVHLLSKNTTRHL